MMKKRLLAAAVALWALPLARPLAAQTKHEVTDKARFHLSLNAGTTSTGPAADLRAAFVREGYNEAAGCGYFNCTPRTYPYSVTGWGQTGLPFAAELRYRVAGPAEIGVVVGRTPIGETLGYRYPLELDLAYGVTLLAATAGVSLPLPLPASPHLNLGGGPALYGAFWKPFGDNNALPTGHENVVGMLGRAGFEVPVDNGVLIGFDFQYRSVGTINVGPIALPNAVNRHDLPVMPSDFNHWYASVGFSIGL